MGKVSNSDTTAILGPPKLEGADPMFVSERFQWLPSDFSVDGDGKVALVSPYINNIHPTHHKELYSVIPESYVAPSRCLNGSYLTYSDHSFVMIFSNCFAPCSRPTSFTPSLLPRFVKLLTLVRT